MLSFMKHKEVKTRVNFANFYDAKLHDLSNPRKVDSSAIHTVADTLTSKMIHNTMNDLISFVAKSFLSYNHPIMLVLGDTFG